MPHKIFYVNRNLDIQTVDIKFDYAAKMATCTFPEQAYIIGHGSDMKGITYPGGNQYLQIEDYLTPEEAVLYPHCVLHFLDKLRPEYFRDAFSKFSFPFDFEPYIEITPANKVITLELFENYTEYFTAKLYPDYYTSNPIEFSVEAVYGLDMLPHGELKIADDFAMDVEPVVFAVKATIMDGSEMLVYGETSFTVVRNLD